MKKFEFQKTSKSYRLHVLIQQNTNESKKNLIF